MKKQKEIVATTKPSVDLKLLIDVAWASRYHLVKLEYQAADRLVNRGLISNEGSGIVEITPAGLKLIGQFDEKVRRMRSVT